MPNDSGVTRVDPAEFKARLRGERVETTFTRAASALQQMTGSTDDTSARIALKCIAEYVIAEYAAKLNGVEGAS